ncbi:MAG: hypothetical protein JRG86_01200 [Deltaproteobacteria bacterium]|jgi:hypothetical protein|nr:hypothetical protein [Deltaproteobacteria bacterium]MBW2500027.1 hypothetical protein [Deltaproteobacteria bacterium]
MSNQPANPIATDEQHELERHALELFAHPRLVSTMKEIRQYWSQSVPRSQEMLECLDAWAFEEVMFAAVVWSLNQDALRPKVITITRLAHTLDGVRVPGSRWGIDNPDSVYRVIPISGSERYVIRGRVPENRVTENYFTLWDDAMGTVNVFDGKDIVLDADRRFEITVDSDPAKGRPNHIQSAPEAHEFYIRDVVMDWKTEMINTLSVERLGDPPSAPPPTLEEELDRASRYMWKWAKESDRWNAQCAGNPENHFEFTIDRDTDGALRNQIYILGRFHLESDEEALVLDVDLGGADYFIAPISNDWGTTNEIQHRNGSLNRAQSVANDDGTLTFVLSTRDPGVHNWLDPSDLHEGILTLRWAEFPKCGPEEALSASSKIVPLGELEDHLPPGTRFVTPDERRAQLAERAAGYAWRLLDH